MEKRKSKLIKTGSLTGAKGGSTKMAGKQSAGPQPSGVSMAGSGSGGGKFASGGSTKMFGKQSAAPGKAR